jgi:hypothetical protein
LSSQSNTIPPKMHLQTLRVAAALTQGPTRRTGLAAGARWFLVIERIEDVAAPPLVRGLPGLLRAEELRCTRAAAQTSGSTGATTPRVMGPSNCAVERFHNLLAVQDLSPGLSVSR